MRLFRFLLAVFVMSGIIHPSSSVFAGPSNIIINEIHYHTPTDFEEDEYLELFNRSNVPIDISHWVFSDGISYTFPAGSVVPSQSYIVVVKNKHLFENSVFPERLFGNYQGSLNNGGERIALSDPDGNVIDEVEYDDEPPWPTTPDGQGASLERRSPSESSSHPSNWGSATTKKKGRWLHVSSTGVVTNARFYIALQGNGTVWLDDISLVKEGTEENLIKNPGFENPLDEDNSWSARGTHENSQRLMTDQARSGEYVMQLTSSGESENIWSNSLHQRVSNVEVQGPEHVFSFWLRVIDAQGTLEAVQLREGGVTINVDLGQSIAQTPGEENSLFTDNLPPYINDVNWEPFSPKPADSVTVSTFLMDKDELESVDLTYTTLNNNDGTGERRVSMSLAEGTLSAGTWEATFPPQDDRTLVRFRIEAVDKNGMTSISPALTEPRWTYSYFHYADDQSTELPVAFLYEFGPDDQSDFRGASTLIIRPPQGDDWYVHDHIITTPRKSGFNVFFLKHYEWRDMSGINIVFEPKPRYALAEWLSYKVYHSIGVLAGKVNHYRFFVNDRARGYYLIFEQPNKHFMARNGLDNDGNLYKIIWNYDRSLTSSNIIRQHEKKTNLSAGYEDVIEMVTKLNTKSGAEQAFFIETHLAVDEIIDYFVGCQLISDWDGYFNNHFVYHDMFGSRQWYIFPWDKDKTWGDSDAYRSILPYYDFYDFPILFGADGTPRSGKGNGTWWRPPGFISGAFLSNPAIQNRYLHRLGYVAKHVFTPEKWLPVINDLEGRLEPEVIYRAQVLNLNRNSLMNEFHDDIESFRRQVIHRREYILSEVEKRIGPVSVTDWPLY